MCKSSLQSSLASLVPTVATGNRQFPAVRNAARDLRPVLSAVTRTEDVRVQVVEPRLGSDEFENLLRDCLDSGELAVIIARRPCFLIAKQLREYDKCDAAKKVENECA